VRLLLDEQLPRRLGLQLAGHEVRSVRQQGWAGIKNGELLRRAVAEGFEVFVTADASLEFQQPLSQFPIRFIVVRAVSHDIDDLLPLVPTILAAIERSTPGNVETVSWRNE
jgi:predicted nuclease of predicted toxin-antitoxin system